MDLQKLGFFLVDKPFGIGSFGIVKYLRRILNIRRIGYAGTLDPLASGLMVVAVGEATKLLTYLEKMDKIYEVEMMFGQTSATYDAEGPFTSVDWKGALELPTIECALKEYFSGEREQRPPQYSAVQVGGKRAYALARKGVEIELKKRKVNFFQIVLDHFSWPRLNVTVHCSSGTYIRSFVHDLGQILGCGAYVTALRRTKIGTFEIQKATLLEQITGFNFHRFLIKPEDFFYGWARLSVTLSDYAILSHGGYIPNITHCVAEHILALSEGKCVGILETANAGSALKFLKKFVI